MAPYNTLHLATRLITMVVSVNPIMVLIVVASSTHLQCVLLITYQQGLAGT